MKRVGVISLGCAKNLVDTEVMIGHLGIAGCELVLDPAEADVIVVNTCAFIESARQESIDTILAAAEYKKTGRLQQLVVAGCMVQRYKSELAASLPEVDAFVDLDELHLVGERIREASPALPVLGAKHKPAGGLAWTASSYLYDDATPRARATPSWSAYIKIAEGCDHTCSFCAIPSFRGRFRSRQPDSIVREATALAAGGVREINLIAQDTSHYGRDLGQRDGLALLLERLDAVPDLRWIRLHYLYPNTITDRLVETIARLPRVLGYVDMPLQHANADVLRRMRRGGSGESHLRLLEKFRRALPEATLRTTFIVGFPGETDAEFCDLLDFVREARFDHVGAFTYSHEEGTSALEYPDDVPKKTQKRRWRELMDVQQKIVVERNRERVGRRVEVLVEGAHRETEHLLVGRMRGQAPDVDGQVLLNDGIAQPGEFVQVLLTGTAGYDLVGSIVGAA